MWMISMRNTPVKSKIMNRLIKMFYGKLSTNNCVLKIVFMFVYFHTLKYSGMTLNKYKFYRAAP